MSPDGLLGQFLRLFPDQARPLMPATVAGPEISHLIFSAAIFEMSPLSPATNLH